MKSHSLCFVCWLIWLLFTQHCTCLWYMNISTNYPSCVKFCSFQLLQYFIMWIYCKLLFHLTAYGAFGLLKRCDITNSTSVYIFVHDFGWTYMYITIGQIPRSRISVIIVSKFLYTEFLSFFIRPLLVHRQSKIYFWKPRLWS